MGRSARIAFAFALALGVVAVDATSSSNAFAQPTDHERAHTHFEEGRKRVKEGRCDLAIEEFRTSIDFEPNVGARLNLGDCYVTLGRLPEGWHQFKEAETLAQRQNDPRLEETRRSAATTESKLVRVIVREPEPSIEGLVLTIDGQPAGSRPWLIAVTPNAAHAIESTTPNGQKWHESVNGQAGESVRLTIAFPSPTQPPNTTTTPKTTPVSPHPPPTPATSSSTLRTVGYVAGGVGLAALATGAVFGVITLSQRSDLARTVNNNPLCSGAYPNATCDPSVRDSIQTKEDHAFVSSTVSTIGILSGAVLLAGGLVLVLFIAPSSSSTSTSPSPSSASLRVRGSSLTFEGAF